MGLVAAGRETSVVLVALASGWMLKERVNWLAIGAVFIGVALLRVAGRLNAAGDRRYPYNRATVNEPPEDVRRMEAPMGYENIRLTEEGDFAVVTMCRPERRNALSEAHLRELLDAFETVGRSEARGVVLAGEGPAFCAGHDFGDMVDRDLDSMRQLLDVCADFMQLLQRLPQPVIAQVDGIATAAGCQLVASCDLAVARRICKVSDAGWSRRLVLPHARRRARACRRSQASARDAVHRGSDRCAGRRWLGGSSIASCPKAKSHRRPAICCAVRRV